MERLSGGFSSPSGVDCVSECLACGHVGSSHWAEASDEEYFTIPDRFSYLRCDRCAALFIEPVPRNSLTEIYPKNYYSFDERVTKSWLFGLKDWLDRRFFRQFVRGLKHEQINVLDIGGGSGIQLSSFSKVDRRVARTVIVDIDAKAGAAARERGHDFFCGRIEDYVTTDLFEVILMLNLIEHVDDPGKLLCKALGLLAPQGILIVKTPNTDSLDARLFRHHNWGGYHCPRHWVLFNRENLAALAAQCGLNIRYFHYTQGAPFWTTSIMFALGRKKWIDISRTRPVPSHPLYPLLNAGFAAFDMIRGLFAKTSQMFVILDRP
jgi:2-polyprenyl-3-methyl-5-hydroxy-6-metoxy-1,4-benzoquinol methylase